MVKALLLLPVLPPINLILAILAGLCLYRVLPRFSLWLVRIAAVLLFAITLPGVSETALYSLEIGLPLTPPPDNPPQAIVILGGDMQRSAGHSGGYTVGRLSLERLRAGAELYRRTHLPILIAGGTENPRRPPVAALMAQSMTQDFQVPVRWVEPRSRDTWENARNSAEILHAAGIRSVYVVTHAWHERRAIIAFAPTGITVTAAPVVLETPPHWSRDNFIPSEKELLVAYYAAHEWIGCAWYSLR
ncbi:MAG TPA: YdcF family protein [Acetobacteraceae bacterium]|jgi:uncharacterized SAM-binding protein YcdF (DUF218 family)